MCRKANKRPRTQNHTKRVVVCSACVVRHRKYAEHEITPTKVWFHPRRVQEAFVEKEEILLVTITVNEINKT